LDFGWVVSCWGDWPEPGFYAIAGRGRAGETRWGSTWGNDLTQGIELCIMEPVGGSPVAPREMGIHVARNELEEG
jgi:hypothetical protein